MSHVSISGYCPVQNKETTITAKLFDESTKYIGRVECEYIKNGGYCNQNQCPIVSENHYRQF